MTLHIIDWLIIVLFLVLILGVGLTFTKQAGKNVESFFLGGRNLPWWIAGTSMVATTFAADTPLLVTELVAQSGVSGNWLWWNGLIGGMLATFFFAKLWRKANIITDVELTELRYSGKAAAFLRGFKAVYLGIFMNAVIIAWVNVALGALLTVFFGIPENQLIFYLAGAMFVVMLYSSLSGLLGVAVTDFIQFIVAMTGCIILAIVVVNSDQIGGIVGLQEKLPAATFNFFPSIELSMQSLVETTQVLSISLATFLAFIGVQWWASWYPGAEPGGGGYIAQRMMSAKNEEHALKATLFFQIAHYALRPWPWILVGLCAIVLYPDLSATDKKLGYALAMRDFLPTGLKGLLLVAFFAAYMSTISTQLNWGTSYIVNDLYHRFLRPNATQKQLVMASRLNTFLLMLVALIVTTQIQTLESVFKFMIECGAGLGAVLILRWYWWRINAVSEIVATIAPFIVFTLIKLYTDLAFPYSLFITVSFTTIAWIIATFLTQPTDLQVLKNFYIRIQPDGFWKPVTKHLSIRAKKSQIPLLLTGWLLGIGLGYACLFGLGKLIFADWQGATIYGIIAIICLWGINKVLKNNDFL
ncbi:MAG: sodium:proline symporter [Gammaproteobacteria bacterium]|nr:MAG: sodium:proline symporter [Gammaproteobacteria bacterium]RKZ43760.1 MAG: sodium:proline symporter [Gammaproteobacteria bacterium]RKZ75728.1 MAG: sodium:proline symporter [Gammaproteobacteria bacterium]